MRDDTRNAEQYNMIKIFLKCGKPPKEKRRMQRYNEILLET